MDQSFAVTGYYRPFLGPFPFKDFLIVEKNAWGYGQAPAGMMFITQEAFNQQMYHHQMEERAHALGDRNLGLMKTMDVRHIFAHEVAHQYWGTVVRMPSWEDQWLTESFADYCATLYDRDAKGKSYYSGDVNAYLAAAKWSTELAPIPLANALLFKDPFLRLSHRRNLLYAKGPALLAALHQELGEEVFLTWLKSTQSNFRWSFATTKRVFDLLGFIAKKDYAPYLEKYFWGLELPSAVSSSTR